jgi:hypothetical protein
VPGLVRSLAKEKPSIMSDDNKYEDPFTDPFDDQAQHDPFVDDHFGNRQQTTSNASGILSPLPDSTAVLVLGILSILGAFCYGIVGLILGIIAVAMAGKPTRLYRNNPGNYTLSSYSNLNAGKICGIIGLCLSILVVLIVFFAVLFAISDSGRGYRY